MANARQSGKFLGGQPHGAFESPERLPVSHSDAFREATHGRVSMGVDQLLDHLAHQRIEGRGVYEPFRDRLRNPVKNAVDRARVREVGAKRGGVRSGEQSEGRHAFSYLDRRTSGHDPARFRARSKAHVTCAAANGNPQRRKARPHHHDPLNRSRGVHDRQVDTAVRGDSVLERRRIVLINVESPEGGDCGLEPIRGRDLFVSHRASKPADEAVSLLFNTSASIVVSLADMKMPTFLVLLAALALPLNAQERANPERQREAMKRLSFLVGQWHGEATLVVAGGVRRRLTQTEDVRFRLDGLVLLVEGTGRDPETGAPPGASRA